MCLKVWWTKTPCTFPFLFPLLEASYSEIIHALNFILLFMSFNKTLPAVDLKRRACSGRETVNVFHITCAPWNQYFDGPRVVRFHTLDYLSTLFQLLQLHIAQTDGPIVRKVYKFETKSELPISMYYPWIRLYNLRKTTTDTDTNDGCLHKLRKPS
jgi:hypothetical protein